MLHVAIRSLTAAIFLVYVLSYWIKLSVVPARLKKFPTLASKFHLSSNFIFSRVHTKTVFEVKSVTGSCKDETFFIQIIFYFFASITTIFKNTFRTLHWRLVATLFWGFALNTQPFLASLIGRSHHKVTIYIEHFYRIGFCVGQ